jgi:magnesium-transporting ATPase (P-type)
MAVPLIGVVIVSMVKDAFEDYKRKKNDTLENTTKTLKWNGEKDWETVPWQQVYVGDIIRVREDEFIPCDLLLLNTKLPKGVCYVETKNLDGETNLKTKMAHEDINPCFNEDKDFIDFDGQIICEQPNNAIYKFEGQCTIRGCKNGELLSLSNDNVVLRGMSIRNTEYVTGVCIFSGHHTKVMQNSAKSKVKKSQLELHMNTAMI